MTAMQSCIDKDYDLDDMDLTIGTDSDLTLPMCSTGDIILKNIMDLKEDGVVQFVTDGAGNSYFAVMQDGKANIAPVSIQKISFKPNLSSIDPISINLRELANLTPRQARKKISVKITLPIVGEQTLTIPDDQINFHYDLNSDDAKYVIDASNSSSRTKISNDVIQINKVEFKDNTQLVLNMSVNGFFNWIPSATLSNMVLTLPKDLHVSKCTLMGQDAISIEDGTINLSDEQGVQIPTNGSDITLVLTLAGMEQGENFKFDSDTHIVSFGGEFGVSGTFQITAANIDEAALNTYLANNVTLENLQTIYTTRSLACIMPEKVTFTGQAEFTGEGIVLEKFQGKLQHEVDQIEPIKLDKLPNFLNDSNVVLDLNNPILLLKARQELPATATTSLTLKSTVNGATQTVKISDLSLPGKQDIYYYIADKPLSDKEKSMLPAEYRNATRLTSDGKVVNLIKKIPDQINVEVAPIALDASQTPIDITDEYDVKVEYKVFAPLTLGNEFLLVYSDTERDWAKDLKDYEDLNAGSLELKAKAHSNLPAKVTFSLTPIDNQGHRVQQLDVNNIVIDASPNGTDKVTDVVFTIKPRGSYTINDVLTGKNGAQQLDGITYVARIDNAVAEATLREDAKIVLKEIQLTLKGGITVDANDKK